MPTEKALAARKTCKRSISGDEHTAFEELSWPSWILEMLELHLKHHKDVKLWCRLQDFEHPAAGDGVWGAQQEVPSFLYGMPLQHGRVFLEETCLVTKPALPFAVLKRRLERRLKAMGIKVCAQLDCMLLLHAGSSVL